ncbi:MAG: LPS-assembly protein LptD [Gammaproteobacteria bacterium]|nr:LPS-assembly protein LptD [Gammaproteobacteria bacterium]
MKKFGAAIILIISSSAVANPIQFDKLPESQVAHYLGWKTAKNSSSLCAGYYFEPKIVRIYQTPGPIKSAKITISTNQQTIYTKQNSTTLKGKVTISQKGREVTADKIILKKDKKTKKLAYAHLYGHVTMREHGRLIVSSEAIIDFKKGTIIFKHAIYRITTVSPTGLANVFGRAATVERDSSKTLTLLNATYSTCQPNACTWQVRSSKLKLNSHAGYGKAYNVALTLKKMPIAYLPYLRFPLGKKRKSGFLFPSATYSNKSGFSLGIPYYLNLAPNYDALLTADIITKRGVLGKAEVRYITQTSQGKIHAEYIPDDRLFKKYQKDSAQNYPTKGPVLSKLVHSSDNRGYFSWYNQTKFNQNWQSLINLNYVTDDYFFYDFGNKPWLINSDQLLNQAEISYSSQNWYFLTRVLGFQTLRQITQNLTTDNAQYRRLPQVDLNLNLPHQKGGFSYQLNNDFVYFDHSRDIFTKRAITTGARLNIQPEISRPTMLHGVNIDPELQVPITFYQLQHSTPGMSNFATRALPIFDIDSNLELTRPVNVFHNQYTQTLEPRLFYLWAPYENQDNITLFDTDLSPFNFDNMFRTNRFDGYDRIGDANQVTLALTSKLLDSNTGIEKLSVSIGQIFALKRHDLFINNEKLLDPLANHFISPLVGQMTYYLTPHWSATGDMAWDFSKRRINNDSFSIQYQPNQNTVFNFGYYFIKNGDMFANNTVSLNRIDTSFAWQLQKHWRILGDWNYNISSKNAQTYFYGLEYNSCCWAVRLVNSNLFRGYDPKNKPIFDHRIYIQFLLKGLGNIGNSDNVSSLITSRINGFNNYFDT